MKTYYLIQILIPLLFINTPGHCNPGNPRLSVEDIPRENIYIHTDRDIYFAGDRLFFKGYLQGDSPGYAAAESRITYIALSGANGSPVSENEITVDNETLQGSIVLPDTLGTGLYNLRGWTNIMLIDETPPFSKQLMVINRFDSHITDFINNNRYNSREEPEHSQNNDFIEYLPYHSEGPLARICYHQGDKSFVEIMADDRNNMLISLADTVNTGEERHIAILKNDDVLWEQYIRLTGTPENQLVKMSDLQKGALDFVISDSDKNEITSFQWINLTGNHLINIKTDKEVYDTREKISVVFDTRSSDHNVASASLTVTRKENLLFNSPDILSTFYQNSSSGYSDLENAAFIITNDGLIPAKLLLSENIKYPDNQSEMLIIPEINGSVISGRVLDARSNEPVSDATVFLSANNSVANLKYSITKSDGSFYFLQNEYYHGKTLYISLYNAGELIENYRIVVREKYSPLPFDPRRVILHDNIHAYIEEAITFKRVQQAYNTAQYDYTPLQVVQTYYSIPFLYRTPCQTINTDEYLQLDDLAEIVREIVPLIRIRGGRDNPTASVISSRTGSYMPGEPLFFMNGVHVPALKDIIDLPSDNITSIDVLSVPWSFGSMVFNGGIVSFLKREKADYVPFNPQYTIIEDSSPETEVNFTPRRYTEGESYDPAIPDLRETLFWDPSISLDNGIPSDISFYTSDLPGDYSVIVEGLTTTGKPFSGKISITVK